MSDRGRGPARAPRVWLDGEEVTAIGGSVRVEERAVVEGGRGWGCRPVERSELYWTQAEAGRGRHPQPELVQLFFPDLERGFLAFLRSYSRTKELCVASCDLLELESAPPARAASRGVRIELLELDQAPLGQLEATLRYEPADEAGGPRCVRLSVRVPAGEVPSEELMRLAQPRVGRWLRVLEPGGESLLLRDPVCRRAWVRGRADRRADADELELEFELECVLDRAARGPQLGLGSGFSTFEDPRAWLRALFARSGERLEPVEHELVEALDAGEPERVDQQWVIYTDWLLASGSSWGRALTGDFSGLGPAQGREQLDSLAALDELEGGRWGNGARQWSPWIQLQWRGPFVTRMWIRPMWSVSSFERPRLRWPGDDSELGAVSADPVEHSAQTAWTEPGFDPRPELAELLALPCCRLLSPARIELLLPPPSWKRLLASEASVARRGELP